MSVAQSGISTINSIIFGVVSIMLNIFLIYVIRRKATHFFGAFKHIMVACAVFDAFFSAINIVCSPTFAATPEMSALLVVNGGIPMSETLGRVMLIIFVFQLCNSVVIPPCLFVFRYLQICRHSYVKLHHRRLLMLFTIPFLFASLVCGMICFAAWPTQSDIDLFTPVAYDINVEGNYTFIVATLQKNDDLYDELQSGTLFAGAVSVVLMLVATMIAIIFCARRISAAVKRDTSDSTRGLDIQLRKTLFAQAASPFILLHLPFYVSVLGPLFEARTGEASNYFPFLFAWCPAINPIITLYFVNDFRQFVISMLKKRNTRTRANTFHAKIVMTVLK